MEQLPFSDELQLSLAQLHRRRGAFRPAIDHYERLVLTQGWSLERYSRWLADAMASALCPLS